MILNNIFKKSFFFFQTIVLTIMSYVGDESSVDVAVPGQGKPQNIHGKRYGCLFINSEGSTQDD